jgi:hypothetical protein
VNIRLGADQQGQPIELPVDSLFKERLLIQGISGSWKSSLSDSIMKQLMLNYKPDDETVPQVILDWEGERIDNYPNFGQYIILKRVMDDGSELTLENARDWGEITRQQKLSVIIDLSTFKSIEEREQVIFDFVSAMIDVEKKYWTPCFVLIDEGHNLCKQSGKCHSRDAIIRLAETGRKRGLATIILTQRLAQLNKNASAQLANRIIGRTIEVPDRESACKLLGMPISQSKELAELKAGEFFVFGNNIEVNSESSIDVVKMIADEQTEEELGGFQQKPFEVIEKIKSDMQNMTIPEPSELTKLRMQLHELEKRMYDTELIGYSKAMGLVRNRLEINNANAGFLKKKRDLEFEEKIVRGMTIVDMVVE